jgi:hypothetical protein
VKEKEEKTKAKGENNDKRVKKCKRGKINPKRMRKEYIFVILLEAESIIFEGVWGNTVCFTNVYLDLCDEIN